MSTSRMTTPSRPAPVVREPDVYHLVCCDSSTALCGEDVSDVPYRPRRVDESPCPLCKLAEDTDAPCPGCPVDRDGVAT